METLLRMVSSNPIVPARISKAINAFSIAAGAWTLSHMVDWLAANATFFDKGTDEAIAGTVATCVAGLIIAIGGFVRSQMAASTDDAKLKAAAITGDASQANNSPLVKQIKQISKTVQAPAGTPQALAEITAKLNAGGV